jgi:nitroreductase
MKFKELLVKNRSYRRFYEEEVIPLDKLKEVIGNVCISPSPANLQPLKFILVNDKSKNEEIFPCLKWAGYLKQWNGPGPGERPSAYIIILGDRDQSSWIGWDYGIALQTIMLSLTEMGYGSCAIAACDKVKLKDILKIPKNLELAAVMAIGKPKEKVVLDQVLEGNIKYWRDDQDVHHVPKRQVEEVVLKTFA